LGERPVAENVERGDVQGRQGERVCSRKTVVATSTHSRGAA
jgi:hypothetical protein